MTISPEQHEQGGWFSVTLASIGDAVITTDDAGRVTFLNPVAESLTGWSLAEAKGRPLEDVFHIINEFSRQAVESPVGRVLREGTVVGLANHTLLVAKDGREIPIDDSGAPIRDSSGRVAGVVLIFRDVTQRKQAERELHRQREWLRVTLASIGDAVITTDTEGRVTFLNPVAEALTGWKLPDAAGQPLESVFSIVNEYTQQPVENPVARVLRDGTVVGLANHTSLIARDGTVRPIADSAAPIQEGEGEVAGVVLIFRDVSAERRAEVTRRRLAAIVESSDDAILSKTLEGIITSWNQGAERLYGYSAEEVVGQHISLVVPPERLDELALIMDKIRRGEVADHFETLRRRKDGSLVDVSVTVSPVADATGQLIGASAIARDISEKKRAARQLRESESRKAGILDTALDGIITIDHQSRIIEFNPAAARMFGYPQEEVLGRDMAQLLVPPSLREQHYHGLAHYLSTGDGPVLGRRIEMPALRADGTEFPIELAIVAIRGEGSPIFTAHLRELTEAKRTESRRAARLAATQILAEATTLDEAVPLLLQRICEALEWDVGAFWQVDRDAQVLRCRGFWHRPAAQVAHFEDLTHQITFAHGVGLPGRIWSTARPAWIPDVVKDDNFPRAPLAGQENLHGGLGFPVIVGSEFLGVVEFFSREIREPDADLLEMMGTIGGQIGQFLERQQAEQARRESEERFRLLADSSPVLIWLNGLDGCEFVNRAYLDYAGVTPADVREFDWAQFIHPDDREAYLDTYRAAFAKRQPYSAQCRFRRADGQYRWMKTAGLPRFSATGEFQGYVGSTFDVTDIKLAEESVRASEKLFKTLTSHAPVGIFQTDVEGNCLFVNETWCELAGMSPEAAHGPGWTAALHPDDRDRINREWYAATQQGRDFESEYRFSTPEGRESWLKGSAVALRDDTGQLTGYIGTITDITERKQAERVVLESEERLRLALDAGRMGTWEWNIETKSVDWSPGLEAIHGLPAGTFGGNFDAFQQNIHPEDRERVLRSIGESLEQATEHLIEYRIIWSDGSQHWVEGRGKLFRDAEGKPFRMVGVCADIDQRKRVEERTQFLADASETLATLVDYESTLQKVARLAVPFFADWCAVDMLDEDGKLRRLGVAHVDPAKVELAHELHRRFPPDPDAPQGVWNIIRTGDGELIPELTDEVLESTVKEPELLQLLHELGLKSYIGVPLSVRGKVLGVLTFITAESGRRYGEDDLAVAEDLAHRAAVAVENTRLYHALRAADRRKDEFLALLGHELRNPLAPISNALHVLRLPQADDAMRARAREMLERQVEHMVRLVDDLLDVSRIMRGKVELRPEPVELGAVVSRAIETVQPVIEAEGHRFIVSLAPEPLWVRGDLMRLAQVVANLLHNAAKYTEKGGQITLTTAREDNQAVVRVRDTGIGLAPDTLSRIFEMFFQAERRTKEAHGGLGIGLSLVRGLVESHGGSVEAHSAGPGAGSEFVVRLPLLVDQRSGEATDRAAPSDAPRLGPRRVLVVDDNVDAADSLAMLLRLLGQEVIVAYDGPAALRQAEATPPQVAFIDLGMPGMDGFELAMRFRAHAALKDVALVALTGWGQPEDRQRTKETGFDHHLVKPVEAEVVRRLLGELIAASR